MGGSSMKILFTADLHLKLGQKNVPIDWAKSRYRKLFSHLERLSKTVELTIIGGDIFDRNPNMDELELYFELLDSIKSHCVVYSGNHEAVKKSTTFLSYMKTVTSKLNHKALIIDDFQTYMGIDFIPYNRLKEAWPDDLSSNILCTHVRAEIPPHVKAEIPLEMFDKWDLVLAGDLHSYENSQRNILYPGSPVTTSFHRNRVDTGVIILDTETLEHEWVKLDLPQLIRKTIKAGEEPVPGEVDHIVYEIEGDMHELASVENSDLIDKKIVRRSSDAELILSAEMTIAEEVKEYLTYILNLNDKAIESVLKELAIHENS